MWHNKDMKTHTLLERWFLAYAFVAVALCLWVFIRASTLRSKSATEDGSHLNFTTAEMERNQNCPKHTKPK
jgi:hypothetical protein